MIGPGLAKVRGLPLVVMRRGLHVRTSDASWRELLDGADVVSEGSVRVEPHGRIWYGSTSIILRVPEDTDASLLAELANRTVHLRLRAVRTALREASLRAPARLGRLMCELHVSFDDRGVRIDVDVQAPLIERSALPRAAP